MPSAAWMFIACSARISSIVVMPPAAVISCASPRADAGTSRDRSPASCLLCRRRCRETRSSTVPVRDHFLRREVGRFLPALDHDLAVLRIERNQNSLRPHRRRRSSSITGVNAAVPTITRCAPCAISLRARSAVRTPPPTRHFAREASNSTSAVVLAPSHRGIEIDHLNLRKRRELAAASRAARRPPAPSRGPAPAGPLCRPSDRCTE